MSVEDRFEPEMGPGRGGVLASNKGAVAAGLVSLALLVALVVNLSAGHRPKPAQLAQLAPVAGSTTTTRGAGAADETFQSTPTKDPFAPLVTPAAAPATPTTLTTPTTPSGGGASPSTTVAASQERITLLNVATDNGHPAAQVQVNNTVFQRLAPGQTFAGNLKVISLSQSTGCGSFLFGDEQFRLCKGQQVVK